MNDDVAVELGRWSRNGGHSEREEKRTTNRISSIKRAEEAENKIKKRGKKKNPQKDEKEGNKQTLFFSFSLQGDTKKKKKHTPGK